MKLATVSHKGTSQAEPNNTVVDCECYYLIPDTEEDYWRERMRLETARRNRGDRNYAFVSLKIKQLPSGVKILGDPK